MAFQVTSKLCMRPTYFAPISVQQKIKLRRLWRHFYNRKNGLFSWAEVGAKHIGITQSLLVICKLHDINPYTYWSVYGNGLHINQLQKLTPGLWKEKFTSNPLRSDLYLINNPRWRTVTEIHGYLNLMVCTLAKFDHVGWLPWWNSENNLYHQ